VCDFARLHDGQGGTRTNLELSGDALSASSNRFGGTILIAWPARTVGTRKAAALLTQAEFLDNALVAIRIVFLEVVEQATPLADQHEKSAA
jgi:hypothetical protein